MDSVAARWSWATDVIRIEIPGPPKGKPAVHARAVTTKTGKTFAQVYTPTASTNEMGVVRYYAEKAMNGRLPLKGAVDLRISMYMPIPASMSKRLRAAALATPPTHFPTQKPDWDNQGKYMDALKQVVWVDDKQVVDGHVFKRYSDRPRIVIEIRSKVGEL